MMVVGAVNAASSREGGDAGEPRPYIGPLRCGNDTLDWVARKMPFSLGRRLVLSVYGELGGSVIEAQGGFVRIHIECCRLVKSSRHCCLDHVTPQRLC